MDEIRKRGFSAERQVPIAIVCRGVRFDEGFRADIIIESKVIIELKSVERITNAHKKQLLSYLKLTGMKLGYLLNFGEDMMKRGITRTVNDLPEKNPWRTWRLGERKTNSNNSLQRTEYRAEFKRFPSLAALAKGTPVLNKERMNLRSS